jgi:hypothetical protein
MQIQKISSPRTQQTFSSSGTDFRLRNKENNRTSIKSYKKSLQEQGYAEIDIPKDLKEKLDEVERIIERVKSIATTDREMGMFNYTEEYEEHLKKDEQNLITRAENTARVFVEDTLNKIFSDRNLKAIEVGVSGIGVRFGDYFQEIFHKDFRNNGKSNDTIEIAVTYPFAGSKGTDFVPFSEKHHYPETEANTQLFDKIQRIHDPFFYKQGIIDKSKTISADPNKIFIFLCRRASETLGDDFDNKSLIHSVPKEENNERIMFLARYSLKKQL